MCASGRASGKIGMSGILANDFVSRESQHRSKLSVLQGRIVREATRYPS